MLARVVACRRSSADGTVFASRLFEGIERPRLFVAFLAIARVRSPCASRGDEVRGTRSAGARVGRRRSASGGRGRRARSLGGEVPSSRRERVAPIFGPAAARLFFLSSEGTVAKPARLRAGNGRRAERASLRGDDGADARRLGCATQSSGAVRDPRGKEKPKGRAPVAGSGRQWRGGPTVRRSRARVKRRAARSDRAHANTWTRCFRVDRIPTREARRARPRAARRARCVISDVPARRGSRIGARQGVTSHVPGPRLRPAARPPRRALAVSRVGPRCSASRSYCDKKMTASASPGRTASRMAGTVPTSSATGVASGRAIARAEDDAKSDRSARSARGTS